MSVQYSLLDEPWLTAVTQGGEKIDCGIRQLLQQAHTLRALTDPSPMVEYGLYRLLIVLLMDALRPEEQYDLQELLAAGKFDAERLEAYYRRCEQEGCRFGLFDPERPFLQTPYRDQWDKEEKPVCTLDFTIPSGNNHTHFDHRKNAEIAFTYAQAARILPAVQTFFRADGKGYKYGPNGSPPYYTVVQGANLFETLVLSMIDMDIVRGEFDQPPVIWRNAIEVDPKREVAKVSWLYGMFFPARRVHLIPDVKTQSVKKVYYSAGMEYTAPENWTDPHVTYIFSDKGRDTWKIQLPEKSKSDKERPQIRKPPIPVWRNLDKLLCGKHHGDLQILEQFAALKKNVPVVPLVIYGLLADRAKCIDAMRHELQIPTAAMRHPGAAELVKGCIALSERLAKMLESALTHKDIPPVVVSEAEQAYYDACEREMWQMCSRIPAEETESLAPLLEEWVEAISCIARQRYEQAVERIALRGASLVEVAHRRGLLMAEIHKIRKENGRCENSKSKT